MARAGPNRPRRALVAILVIGIGLASAPAAFQMFTRAPKGGRMIEQFRPYMTTAKIGRFQGYLGEIGRADAEAQQRLAPVVSSRLGLRRTDFWIRHDASAAIVELRKFLGKERYLRLAVTFGLRLTRETIHTLGDTARAMRIRRAMPAGALGR